MIRPIIHDIEPHTALAEFVSNRERVAVGGTIMRPQEHARRNVVLIGMPGVGKSTVGVLLAERLAYGFLDTDIHLQTKVGLRLQEIIDRQGIQGFLAVEERIVQTVNCAGHVIATGGSVVYSPLAMAHLKSGGIAVYLDLDPETLAARLNNLVSRGVVMPKDLTIEALYAERLPLYQRYADVRVDCRDQTPEQIVAQIADRINETQGAGA